MIQEINGIRLQFELTGNPDLPVLVLSHSLGVNLRMWDPQMQALSAHYRVLRYDTRGHGGSASHVEPCTVADLGQDVLALLDALNLRQVDFCGLSMGGVIGQWLGQYAPQRLRRLVLANTAAKIGTPETWNARIATVRSDGLASVIPGTLERWFTPGFRSAHPDTVARVEAMLGATSVEGYTNCCAALRDADFRAGASSIGVPVLLIAGREDPVTPCEDLRFLAESIPDSAYAELPAAHLSSVEAAAAFNTAILSFLSQ